MKGDQIEEDPNNSSKKRLTKKFKSSDEAEENTSSPPSEIKNNKSLLEQLLIEIPGEDSRKTRSWHRLVALNASHLVLSNWENEF